MKNIKKKVNELNDSEKKEIAKAERYKYLSNVGLFLIGEEIWWECNDPAEGRGFLEKSGLKETP